MAGAPGVHVHNASHGAREHTEESLDEIVEYRGKHECRPSTNDERQFPRHTMDTISNTQEMLGKVIKKPALKSPLLLRPPFRFLHDIVKNVIKSTGYMEGIFTSEELEYKLVKKEKT
eukprot:TRINITY_DN1291_c0_g1_i2.p2 TRINITY_DN1291_c0_g1~~TRINITY_DN1291_c0_g1_i2.p2  ORF type:complete len:117 (+),score=22.33 TRINITY_DN1291_c0_g1_i2:216-566(+)